MEILEYKFQFKNNLHHAIDTFSNLLQYSHEQQLEIDVGNER